MKDKKTLLIRKTFIAVFSFILVFALFSCKTSEKSADGKVKKQKTESELSKPKDNTAIFINANKEKVLGNYNNAAELYHQCIDLNPSDDASMYELAKLKLMVESTTRSS